MIENTDQDEQIRLLQKEIEVFYVEFQQLQASSEVTQRDRRRLQEENERLNFEIRQWKDGLAVRQLQDKITAEVKDKELLQKQVDALEEQLHRLRAQTTLQSISLLEPPKPPRRNVASQIDVECFPLEENDMFQSWILKLEPSYLQGERELIATVSTSYRALPQTNPGDSGRETGVVPTANQFISELKGRVGHHLELLAQRVRSEKDIKALGDSPIPPNLLFEEWGRVEQQYKSASIVFVCIEQLLALYHTRSAGSQGEPAKSDDRELAAIAKLHQEGSDLIEFLRRRVARCEFNYRSSAPANASQNTTGAPTVEILGDLGIHGELRETGYRRRLGRVLHEMMEGVNSLFEQMLSSSASSMENGLDIEKARLRVAAVREVIAMTNEIEGGENGGSPQPGGFELLGKHGQREFDLNIYLHNLRRQLNTQPLAVYPAQKIPSVSSVAVQVSGLFHARDKQIQTWDEFPTSVIVSPPVTARKAASTGLPSPSHSFRDTADKLSEPAPGTLGQRLMNVEQTLGMLRARLLQPTPAATVTAVVQPSSPVKIPRLMVEEAQKIALDQTSAPKIHTPLSPYSDVTSASTTERTTRDYMQSLNLNLEPPSTQTSLPFSPPLRLPPAPIRSSSPALTQVDTRKPSPPRTISYPFYHPYTIDYRCIIPPRPPSPISTPQPLYAKPQYIYSSSLGTDVSCAQQVQSADLTQAGPRKVEFQSTQGQHVPRIPSSYIGTHSIPPPPIPPAHSSPSALPWAAANSPPIHTHKFPEGEFHRQSDSHEFAKGTKEAETPQLSALPQETLKTASHTYTSPPEVPSFPQPLPSSGNAIHPLAGVAVPSPSLNIPGAPPINYSPKQAGSKIASPKNSGVGSPHTRTVTGAIRHTSPPKPESPARGGANFASALSGVYSLLDDVAHSVMTLQHEAEIQELGITRKSLFVRKR